MKPLPAFLSVSLFAGCAMAGPRPGSAPAATTGPAAPGPCSGPEFSQMDFWLGDWDVSWDASPGTPAGSGSNRIARVLSGCVVEELFDGGPSGLVGRSVSTFHRPLGSWRQTWVDNQGGYFALTGGREGDRFVLVSTRLRDRGPHQRMVFEDIRPDALTWRWQSSPDGGATWTDAWVLRYRRRGPAR